MVEWDGYKELTGGKIVKVTGVWTFPAVIGLIVENNGKYYKLTSDTSIIDVKEIDNV